MIGLIYKDVICLKKNLKLFVAVGIGVLLLAVMFALSCKMGNIADGLKNYDATDTMGLELLITVIDIAMHMVLFIPVAFIGNIIDCFLADYKAGFNNSLMGMPVKYSEIVGARYIAMILYGMLGLGFALVTGIGISAATDSIVFKEMLSVTLMFTGIMIIYMGIVIPCIYVWGAKRSDLICAAPFVIALIAGIIYMVLNEDKMPETEMDIAIILDKFGDFISHKGFITLVIAGICLVASYLLSVVIIKKKRGSGI